mmetsp:Transcript_19653/g.36826  ORF Transcript_19653/g.36826 Transcript_19653/m.36826 type:complete len:406 (+) Transcript_19653:1448-2665(+)
MSHNDINHHIARLKESFLCAAARGGRIQECASLLDLGAEIEWRDENNDDTPLISAVRNGHQDVAALLLAHGANPSVRDQDGNTVMHLASSIGDEGMASLLSPNASALSLSTNNDGMTAIDIAVQRGFNSFAEHLNNLFYEVDDNRGELDEEKDDSLTLGISMDAPSIDSIDDSENDVDDEYDINTVSFSTPTGGDEMQHTIASIMVRQSGFESSIDEEISHAIGNPMEHEMSDLLSQGMESETDLAGENDSNAIPEPDVDCTNTDALIDQLRHMTQLAHTKSRELYQAKYAFSELMQEHDALKNKLSVFFGEDEDSNLTQKSLAELNSLEEKVKYSLERIVKAKEVASTNLEEERVCVICRENSKCVLLMNCRHLCVCKECGHNEALIRCPLCREMITERINVFA